MIENLEGQVTGVVCLRCGNLTPFQVSGHRAPSGRGSTDLHSPIAIVRCQRCGKEASYLTSEVVAFKTMTNMLHAAA
jgi:hypothetical protein